MQFLIVRAKKRGSDELRSSLSVLIDGEKNGTVNELIKVDEGIYDISVNSPGAQESKVNVENTTPEKPMEVVVEVD